MRNLAAALVLMASLCLPSPARADWLFTPWVGMNWSGTADFSGANIDDFANDFHRKGNFGATLGWMSGGVIGLDLDFGWSPNFFQNAVGEEDFEFGNSNVVTLMGNLKIGVPLGGQWGPGLRPYASGGIGFIKSQIGDAGDVFSLRSTDLGVNLGAGISGFFSDHVGLTGDLRYVRSLQDHEADSELDSPFADFRYWRGSVGLTFRFGR